MSDNSVQLFNYDEDQPRDGRGLLIPPRIKARQPRTAIPQARPKQSFSKTRAFATVFSITAFTLVAVGGYGVVAVTSQVATPIVTVIDPYTQTSSTLEFGVQNTLSKHTFFTETRDAFIDEGLTFIEADITRQQLRYFERGVLVLSAEIVSVGERGSWWDAPSGLYQIEKKEDRIFSTLSQVYLPFALTFQSNFVIHGQPVYPGAEKVGDDFVGGGIRISDESAERFFNEVSVGVPVLVHKATVNTAEFVYEPKVPDFGDTQYFIADIDNGTILASSDLAVIAPIASVTKLMTAVVASEKIDLDGRVWVTSPNFVRSLIPRLSEQSSVSTYSLLQLLLVESSNEAAEVLAGEYGREEFIAAMNTKARQLGMLETTFADPSGLSAENISSVGDLYKLAKYIHEQKRFIFEVTADAVVPNTYISDEFAGMVNFNQIQGVDNFIGGKVGETLAAGQTSVSLHAATFSGEERVLVVILLGSDQRTDDILTLIEYVELRFGE